VPDRNRIDERLAGGRAALLATIEQPPLDRIGSRAAAIRRRRRQVRGGAALAVVALVALAVIRPGDGPAPRVAQPPPEKPPVYAGNGITINGLPDPGSAVNLPGAVVDVEFVDPEHGFAVSACGGEHPANCRPSLAATTDGGRGWTVRTFPPGVDRRERPELEVFDPRRLVITIGRLAYVSADAGQTWREFVVELHPAQMRAGDLLRPGGAGTGCVDARVEVWSAEVGPRGRLTNQPALDACQIVPAGNGGRTWWVGGASGGQAAVAVTHDGGATWQPQPLPAGGTARVAALGSHVYAFVLDPSGRLGAVFHSADRGASFDPTGTTALPAGVAGDPVPLLDGRLLVAGPDGHWWVSKDDGRTFVRGGGNLPMVGRLARTAAGYVAYDLFHAGWSAFSTDGSTWRKLDLY
jgi:photosystem II stability/assembly factor-like uncharacterized protein